MKSSCLWSITAMLLVCGLAPAASPSYTADAIRNAANGAAGPFAPNSTVSLYGADLAFAERALTNADIADARLPTTLGGVQVTVNSWPCGLLYVSPGQVNFVLPGNLLAGSVLVRVARQGLSGPEVSIQIQDVVPALFPVTYAPEYAVAQLWPQYSAIDPLTPASSGGIVILYATGLGKTERYPSPAYDEIPSYAGLITKWNDFRVYLNGKALDPDKVWYAGICPNWVGLYQINFLLPPDAGTDPEVLIGIGDKLSPAGLKLAVR
jgi:uncharacterized protein (TIGR03437 family)